MNAVRRAGAERRLGYALVGAGAIATIQAEAISRIPEARLVAVYNRTPDTARALGERWGVDWTADYDEILARPDVDAVSICTPSGARVELAVSAAQAGKHVVCEKPLEVTVERADRIIEACDESGVCLSVIFPARFQPAARAVKEAVAAGRLGRLTLAGAHVKWHRTDAYYASAGWRGTWALDGGGAFMNQAIHWIDLLLWLAGPAGAVSGFTERLLHGGIEVEDVGVAILRFNSGALGTIEATTAAYPGLPARVELHGEHGTIVLEERHIATWKLADAGAGEEEGMQRMFQPTSATGATNPLAIGFEGHRLQLAEITESLLAGRAPLVDGREGRKSIALIRAIYDAAATRREVVVPDGLT